MGNCPQHMPPSVNTNDDIKLAPAPTPVSAAAGCGNAEENTSPSSAFPPKRKSVPCTRTDFLLHFLSRHDKLPFAVCICTREENEGLQREVSPVGSVSASKRFTL